MAFNAKTTLISSVNTTHGPYRASNGSYYAFFVSAATYRVYKSSTLTGTYSQVGSDRSAQSGINSFEGAWSYADDEFQIIAHDHFTDKGSAQLNTYGERFITSSDTWATVATIHSAAARVNTQTYLVRAAYDQAEGRPYFHATGPAEKVMGTDRIRSYAYRWNGSSWDAFAACETGVEADRAPKGVYSGLTRAYAVSGLSSTPTHVYALDNGARGSTAETTGSRGTTGPGDTFGGSTFAPDSVLGSTAGNGSIKQRTEGDPPGAATSKTPSGWSSSEYPRPWSIRRFNGVLYAVAYNSTDDDISYSSLTSAGGTWAAATDIDTNEPTFNSSRLLRQDSDADGLEDSLWLVYYDGTNTVYRQWDTQVFPPAAPTGVTYTAQNEAVKIDWTDSASSNGTHTRIYRGVAGGRLAQIAEVADGTGTYTDSGRTPTLPYVYQLRAYDNVNDLEGSGTTETTVRPLDSRTGPDWYIATDGAAPGSARFTVTDSNDANPTNYDDTGTTSGLQDALDAVAANDVWIHFKAGDFRFLEGTSGQENKTFNTLTNMRITGEGMDYHANPTLATRIRNNSTDAGQDTEPFSFTRCDGLVMSDMAILAAGSSNTTSDGFDSDDADHSYIHHIYIENSRARGLIFDGKDSGATATENVIEDVIATTTQTTQGDVFELLGAKRNVLRRVWAYSGGERGLQINQGGSSVTSDDNVVEDSAFIRNGEDGIEILSGSRNIIRRNYVEGNDQDSAGHDGIEVGGTASLPADDNEIRDNWTSDVQGTKTQDYGVEIANADANNTIVNDNYWGGNASGTISDSGTGTSQSGNTTSDTAFDPIPPIALFHRVSGSDIVLYWYDSPSEDLDDLTIQKSDNDGGSWENLVASHAKVGGTTGVGTAYFNTYTDTSQAGNGRWYRIVANDTDTNSNAVTLSGITKSEETAGTVTTNAQGRGEGRGDADAAVTVLPDAEARGEGRAAAQAIVDVQADAAGAGEGRGAAQAAVVRPVTAEGKGEGRGDAAAVVVRPVTAEARGEGRAAAQAIVDVQAVASARGEGRGDGTATVEQFFAAEGRGEGRGSGVAGSTVTTTAQGRGGGRAAAAAIAIVAVIASGAGEGRADATADVAKVVTAEARGEGRADAAPIVENFITATARGDGRGYALAFVENFATAEARGEGRADATATVVRPVTADARGEGRADASTITESFFTASGAGEGRADAAPTVVRLTSALGRGEGRSDAAAIVDVAVQADGRGEGRADAAAFVDVQVAAEGRGEGRAVGDVAGITASATARGEGRADAAAAVDVRPTAEARGEGAASAQAIVENFTTAEGRGEGAGAAAAIVENFATAAAAGEGRADAAPTIVRIASALARGEGRADAQAVVVRPVSAAAAGEGRADAAAIVDVQVAASGRGEGRADAAATVDVQVAAEGRGEGRATGDVEAVSASAAARGEGRADAAAVVDVQAPASARGEGAGSALAIVENFAAAEARGEGAASALAIVENFVTAEGRGEGRADAAAALARDVAAAGAGEGRADAQAVVVRPVTAAAAGEGRADATPLVDVQAIAEGRGEGTGAGTATVDVQVVAEGRGEGRGFADTTPPGVAAEGRGEGRADATALVDAQAPAAGRGEGAGSAAATVDVQVAASGAGEGRADALAVTQAFIPSASAAGEGRAAALALVDAQVVADARGEGRADATVTVAAGTIAAAAAGEGRADAAVTVEVLTQAEARGEGRGAIPVYGVVELDAGPGRVIVVPAANRVLKVPAANRLIVVPEAHRVIKIGGSVSSKLVDPKDPQDVLDYGFDWELWLDGDTITASSWTVPSGLTKDSEAFTTTTATMRVSGGTAGTSYACVNHITTASGQEKDRTLMVVVREA